MTLHTRTLLIAIAALTFATGCVQKPSGIDGGVGGGGGGKNGDCFEDIDCPNAQLFFCNTTTSKCEPACRTPADCTATVRKQYALDYCASGLGCQCDEGKCVGSLCSADVDCGATQVCRSGKCIDAPAASTVASCAVIPDYVVMKQGEKARFWVSAWSATKDPVVVKDGISWSSAIAGTVTLSGSATASSTEFTAGAANTGPEAAVKASIGGKDCFAKVLVLPSAAPAANTVNVIVVDELSGRPVVGADVLATKPADGASLGAAVVTDTKGFANVPVPAGNTTVTVSIFATDYNYLTVANYDMTGSRFLSFVLRRNQVDKYGGFKGNFNNVPMTSNVHVALSGASIAGSITDLSIAQLLGPSVLTRVKIGTAIDQMNVPLPAGVFLGFTTEKIKDNVSAQGLAGTCDTGNASADATAIANGTCGTRSSWALAGDIPLGDLPIDAFTGGVDNIDFGKVLSRIIPIFKKFNSSIIRDVEFSLKTAPNKTDGGSGKDFTDTSAFTTSNHDFVQRDSTTPSSSVPLAFNFATRVPDLPKFRGTYVDAALILGGAIVPGRGVVPLGIGAGVNTTPADAKTDVQSELPSAGLVSLRMAPTHNGIEGNDYGVIALGLSLKSVQDVSAGLATSAIFSRVAQNKLAFDPKATMASSVVDLGASFPAFPESAHYNYSDVAVPTLGGRTFKFADQTLSGAAGSSVVRVVFTDASEHRWVVYLDPAQVTAGFVLPKPSGTYADRTFNDGLSTGERSGLLVQHVRLNDNPSGAGASITFNKLVEFNSTNADRLLDFTTGFSLIDYLKPAMSWKTPGADGATVAKGSQVIVVVKGFKVGATTAEGDGFVRLSFLPANASCGDVDTKTDASMGKGEISITVPAACVLGTTAMPASMTATLINNLGGLPIAPPVSSVRTAIIQ